MAKRRRLTTLGLIDEMDKSSAPAPAFQASAPVARIAGDAAAQSALAELAQEMRQAREDGRMIVELPLDSIDMGHLTRDRMNVDAEDMAALMSSIRQRGQQTPIEVVLLKGGRYGLISGARRLNALHQLHAQTDEPRFAHVKAILRPAATAPDAYLAMVEENEIRSDLSFYERGRLAFEAAQLGVFDSPAAAVKTLFVNVAPSKRSKIMSFVTLHQVLGSVLRFPEAIPEKLGLALVKAIEGDPAFRDRLVATLTTEPADDVQAERSLLDRMLARPFGSAAASLSREPQSTGSGIVVKIGRDRVTLSGTGVTKALIADLRQWLESRR